MQITYNFLNLPSVIKRGAAVKALYSYYADGSKSRVIDASGTGYDYTGSFKYARKGNTLSLESVAASGGRIHRTATGYEVRYHIADHLGSVRLVTNASGTILEQNDYHPYGTRHANAGHATTPNPYLYGGKELQQDFNVNYYDSHARFQRTDGAFNSQDRLAEKYYSISPYAYCAGNPINYVDPSGTVVDDWKILEDGQLYVDKNDNSSDRFYVEKEDGTFEKVAELERHTTTEGVTLVEFPDQGKGYARYGEKDKGGDHSVQASVAAALFGAINEIYKSDNSILVQFGDMSAYDGSKPGIAHSGGKTSHVNGRNVDVRYIRSDRQLLPLSVDHPAFDKEANQLMVNSFYKFGFKSILSYPTQSGWMLDNTKKFPNHHHHLHLQGFSPNIN